MDQIESAICKKVKQVRLEKGYTQQEIADQTGFERQMIGKLEIGIRTPSASFLRKFAEVCEISLDEIFEVDAKPTRNITKPKYQLNTFVKLIYKLEESTSKIEKNTTAKHLIDLFTILIDDYSELKTDVEFLKGESLDVEP